MRRHSKQLMLAWKPARHCYMAIAGGLQAQARRADAKGTWLWIPSKKLPAHVFGLTCVPVIHIIGTSREKVDHGKNSS
jgi:hypothetical protein